MSRDFVAPTECPVCGEPVPRGARACPGCGADERTGWDEEATRYDGLDLPDDGPVAPRAGGGRVWLLVAVVLTLTLIILSLFH